jgi:hypothetical protein
MLADIYCQTCKKKGSNDCKCPIKQAPTPPPSGPAAPLQDGVLEQPPTGPQGGIGGPSGGAVF